MILFETNIESNKIVNWTALLQTCSNTDAGVVSRTEPITILSRVGYHLKAATHTKYTRQFICPHRRTSWKLVGNPGCELVANIVREYVFYVF